MTILRGEQEAPQVAAATAITGVEFTPPDVPERVHGRYPTVARKSGRFVKMSQVRGEINPSNEDLKASIERTGLLNPIDVAHMSEAALIEYIDFVNQVWGSSTSIEDFVDQREPDGTYYLIIAGHSRHQAIEQLEQEGRIDEWLIEAKVHEITSPEDIIQIQLDENIHTQPPRERRAVALVEAYKWGVVTGKWSTQKEFLETRGDIGQSALYEALAFENLPPDVRNFVLGGKMSYAAGIELGKAAEDLREHIRFQAKIVDEEETAEQTELINTRLLIKLVIETNNIINKKMNSTAAEKRIRAWRKTMRHEMAIASDETGDDNTLFGDLELFTSKQILDQDLKKDRDELAQFVRKYGTTPGSWAMDMIALNTPLVAPETVEQALFDFEDSIKKGAQLIGRPAVVGALLSSE